ncbi:MAG: hypothetical protein KGR26_09370, partial [Cyanobacteria bacterium REEB65]|nr:hypothetical protein [Cyanobacteria bacterium REEB65]
TVWLGLQTHTDFPSFAELYQGRLATAGNGALWPQRTQPMLELGAGHRFSDKFYAEAAVSYSQVLDFIYYGRTDSGLWQPRNFPSWQGIYDERASAQYLWASGFIQHVDVHVQDATGLGQLLQSVGTRHESTWLGGKLKVSIGTSLQYAQLGALQGGNSQGGILWLANWRVGYALDPTWQLYFAGQDWHVLGAKEPALGYFQTPSLITVGLQAQI